MAATARFGLPLLAAMVAVVIGCMAALAGPHLHPTMLAIAVAFLAASIPFAVALGRPFDLFEPPHLFALSLFVLFVWRPLSDLSLGLPAFVGYSPNDSYTLATILAATGALAFYAGYYLPVGASWGARLPADARPIDPQRAQRAALGVCAVALTIYGAFLSSQGGLTSIPALLSGRNAGIAAALHDSSGYLYTAPLWLTGFALLLMAIAPRKRSRIWVLGLALLVLSQLPEVTLGNRANFLPALIAAWAVRYVRRGAAPTVGLLACGAVLLFVFGISLPRYYRQPDAAAGFGALAVQAASNPIGDAVDFVQGGDTAMVDALAVELDFVPNTVPYEWGRTYVEALARPIPRAAWPDKPVAADTRLMRAIWPEYDRAGVGFSFSLFGEPYLNFGGPGVVIILLLFGVAWRTLYTWMRRNVGNATIATVYAASWPFLFVYMRGGIGVDYQRQLLVVLPLLAATPMLVRLPTRISRTAEGGHHWSP